MASQLVVKGEIINLAEEIQFSFNAGQIGNLSISMSNYTEAFKIPRTSQDNVRIMEGLGIPSDVSSLPYTINNVDVLSDYNYIYTGSLIVLKTTELYYEVTVISGTRDIFQLLGDKTFADVPEIRLNLPFKVADTVSAMAIYSDPFADQIFSIANYGGLTHFVTGGVTYMNIDCMAISYHIRYLWNKVFEMIGIPNDTSDIPVLDLANQYFTFPYPPFNDIGAFGSEIFTATVSEQYQNLPAANQPPVNSAYTAVSGSGFSQSGANLTCLTSGLYNLTFKKFYAYGQGNVGGQNILFPMIVMLKKNGSEFFRFEASMNDTAGTDKYYVNAVHNFQVGDVLTIEVVKITNVDSGAFWNYYQYEAPLSITNVEINADQAKEILGFKLADYVKEFMYRFSLIGFNQNGFFNFKRLSSVLNPANAIDWSDKYIRRVEETYDVGFSQNNRLKHKYVNDGADYYDGNIQSNNANLPVEKTLITSNVYVPSETSAPFSAGGPTASSNNIDVRALVTYSIENNSNKVKTEKRNFWNQVQAWPIPDAYFGSFSLKDTAIASGWQMIKSNGFSGGFNGNNWSVLNQIVQNTRYHIIELNLTQVDIMKLDQSVPYYFRQESAYFMLNELQYKRGDKAIGKFTKINN